MARIYKTPLQTLAKRMPKERQWREERQALKLCHDCPNPVKRGVSQMGGPYTRCIECLRKQRHYNSACFANINRMAGVVIPPRMHDEDAI